MIKAVIFDYGNVISQPQNGDITREMERLTGVEARVFASVYEKFRHGFDRGDYSGAEMYARLLHSEGRDDLAKDRALMEKLAYIDMVNWQYTDPGVVAWSLRLKDAGFKLGILSNIPTEFLDVFEKTIPPFVQADYACFSCRVRLIKPDPAIYKTALSGLGVEPEEAVFFDDMPENISAAKALSIHGVLWTGLEPARAALQEILAQEGGLVPGITGQRTIPVTEARTAKVMESGLLPVFATPLMIASMENAASGLAEPYLAPGFSTVGTEVRIKHLSATPVGLTVRARAELTEVDGRRLVFAVSAFDDAGKIGEGIHERFIVENEKFMAKTGAKKSALPGT